MTHSRRQVAVIALLSAYVGLYAWNIHAHFRALPGIGDPMQYLSSPAWGTTYGYWPWLDRITFAVGLRVAVVLLQNPFTAGAAYAGLVNVAIVALLVAFSFRRAGPLGGIAAGVLCNVSLLMLGWATNVYPDATLALFVLLAYVAYSARSSGPGGHSWPLLLAGAFSACAAFSKVVGVTAVLYFTVRLMMARDWKGLRRFAAGVILGAAAVLGAFVLAYNLESLLNVFYQFFRGLFVVGSFTKVAGRNNAVSYADVLLSMKYFPFIALIALPGAYRQRDSRDAFLMAWAWVAFLYAFVGLAGTGGMPIPHYLYTAHVFVILGLSLYAGKATAPVEGPALPRTAHAGQTAPLVLGLATIALVAVGLHLGRVYSPVVGPYDHTLLYYRVSDVFNPDFYLTYPKLARHVYTFGPVLAVASLVWLEVRHSRRALASLLLVASLWASMANGGLAREKVSFENRESVFFHDAARVLSAVPASRFCVYVKAWNETPHGDTVPTFYSYFYSRTKYGPQSGYDAFYKGASLVNGSITFLTDATDLTCGTSDSVLTDTPQAVLEVYPSAVTTQEIRVGGRQLFLMATRREQDEQMASNALSDASLRIDFSAAREDSAGSWVVGNGRLRTTISGAPHLVPGRFAVAVSETTRINGPGGVVDLRAGTLLVWARRVGSDRPFMDLFSVDSTAGLYAYLDASGVLTASYGGALLEPVSGGGAIRDEEWHQVTMTWEDGAQRLYVDGRLTMQARHQAKLAGGERLALGWLGDGTDREQWAGELADVAVFRRALGIREVGALLSTHRSILASRRARDEETAMRALASAKLQIDFAALRKDSAGSWAIGAGQEKTTVTGVVELVPGRFGSGRALSLDATTRIDGPRGVVDLEAGSILLWARRSGVPRPFMDLFRINASSDLYAYVEASGAVRAFYGGAAMEPVGPGGVIKDTQWHQLAMTWTAKEQRFHVDGRLVRRSRRAARHGTGDRFAVGWLGDGTDREQWAGELADIAVFHRPLEAGEIAALLATHR